MAPFFLNTSIYSFAEIGDECGEHIFIHVTNCFFCSEPGLALNAFYFTYPNKKKSNWDKSGDLADQGKL